MLSSQVDTRIGKASNNPNATATSIRVLPHEGIVACLVDFENLAKHVALVVVPDLPPGFGNTVLIDSLNGTPASTEAPFNAGE
jgi:hypothetical protein